ncbi:septation protein SepH [uncultured Demequina sp.]|uniref:septation protein SepH n=1 Tax=uncultured Demequina sp. TaxID=693499 RepID=UPI0025E8CA5D|nr:septation protein SepH [uncultured Demequina sp.]
MTRVSLVRAADDGEHLILASEDGAQFELELTDDLRRTVALTRPRAMQDEETEPGKTSLTPKEIQQRIRGGLNAQELAELTGEPQAALERYEAPVLAERSYIAELARSTRIGREAGAPVLADLVTDRLASRGVDAESVMWDAWREPEEPWKVAADYRVDGRSVRALWVFDHTARAVTAQDEESRWLTETELLDVPIPKRHLSAVKSVDDDAPLDQNRPAMPSASEDEPSHEPSSTELLLEDLHERRGTRESVEPEFEDELDDEDEQFEGFGPAQRRREAEVGFGTDRPTGTSMPHPAGSALRGGRTSGADAEALPEDSDAATESTEAPAAETEPRQASRRGRSSVPSWDEIVFGAKHD